MLAAGKDDSSDIHNRRSGLDVIKTSINATPSRGTKFDAYRKETLRTKP